MEKEQNYKLRKFFIAYLVCFAVVTIASAVFLLLFKEFVEDESSAGHMVFGITSIFGVILFAINALISLVLLIVGFTSKSTVFKLRFLKFVRVVLYIVVLLYLSVFFVGTVPDKKVLFLLGKAAALISFAVLISSYFITRKSYKIITDEIKRLKRIKKDEKKALQLEKNKS